MKSNNNIVLLGMMGSGKSTIGHLLSNKMNFEFIDVDKVIENEVGTKITEIFKNNGEDFFRKFEEKISLKLLKLNKKIISLGGGAFLNKKIREQVLNNFKIFIWYYFLNFFFG